MLCALAKSPCCFALVALKVCTVLHCSGHAYAFLAKKPSLIVPSSSVRQMYLHHLCSTCRITNATFCWRTKEGAYVACCLEPALLGENSACMLLSSATKPAAAAARASCSSMLMKMNECRAQLKYQKQGPATCNRCSPCVTV